MKLLLVGGSFNPVHVGHLIMAEEIRAEFDYDLVLLVPSFRPPHKDLVNEPGPEHRLAMLKLAAAGDPSLAVEDCELRRGGLSYTIDTLTEIVGRYAIEGKAGLVIGDDLIPGFGTWHRPADIAKAADLVCVHRRSVDELPLQYPHRYAHNSLIQLSSSMVRERISEGRPFRRLLDPPVYEYIQKHGLYGLQ